MDASLRIGCQEIIKLTIRLKEMSFTMFYKEMENIVIDGKYIPTSPKTLQRYLNDELKSEKKFNLFLDYSADILGIDKTAIISCARLLIESKGEEYEYESYEKIKSFIKKLLLLPPVKQIEDFTDSLELLDLLKNGDYIMQEELFVLHEKCLNLSPEMKDFLLSLSSDDEKDKQAVSSIMKRLKTARKKVSKLDLSHNKDFCILFDLKRNYVNTNVKMHNTDMSELTWTLRFYKILKENKVNLDIALKYAILLT